MHDMHATALALWLTCDTKKCVDAPSGSGTCLMGMLTGRAAAGWKGSFDDNAVPVDDWRNDAEGKGDGPVEAAALFAAGAIS